MKIDKDMNEDRYLLPISVVIPTRNRDKVLQKTLSTFSTQTPQPQEIVIIDGSEDDLTKELITTLIPNLNCKLVYLRADILGAAAQRNQGVKQSTQPFILFADDDVYLELNCLNRLWSAIQSGEEIGGVSAMITNQKYLPMGRISSTVARFLAGNKMESYAGKLLTPGWGMLPEDRAEMPALVQVEWLNLGATIYRKEALPDPPFQSHFTGYSMMEDITLSATVSKKWKLLNARTARIYHDSQPGDHKNKLIDLSRMELVNRHYVMTEVLHQINVKSYLKFFVFELFGVVSGLQSWAGFKNVPRIIAGKFLAIIELIKGDSRPNK